MSLVRSDQEHSSQGWAGRLKRSLPASVVSLVREFRKAWRHWSLRNRMNAKNTGTLPQVKTILVRGSPIWLELGAGEKRGKNGWVTLDCIPGADLVWDLTEGIPFPKESVSRIHTSHLLEHFGYESNYNLLAECRRALRPNGVLSVSVPNAALYIQAYMSGQELDPDIFFRYRAAYSDKFRIDIVNYIAYMNGQHRLLFDEESLVGMLRSAGFRNARLREFDVEVDPEERKPISIYAIAEK